MTQNDLIHLVKSVMVIDDDKMFQTLIQNHLAECGVDDVHLFISADKAWEAIEAGQHFDLVVLDWKLSGLSGLGFFNRLRCHPEYKTTPVLVASGFLSKEDFILLEEFPCTSLIEKPFSKKIFKDNIRQLKEEADWYITNREILHKIANSEKKNFKSLKDKILSMLKTAPNSLPFGVLAAKVLRKKTAYSESLEIINVVLNKHKNSIYALGEKAKILYKLNDLKGARSVLRTTYNLSPDNVQRLCLLGEIEINLKNPKEARTFFKKALDIDPEHTVAQSGIIVSNNMEEHFTQYHSSSITLGFASLMNLVAISKIHSGHFDAGVEQYKAALSFLHAREHIDKLYFNLGLGHVRYKKDERAGYWFNKISDGSPLIKKAERYIQRFSDEDISIVDQSSILTKASQAEGHDDKVEVYSKLSSEQLENIKTTEIGNQLRSAIKKIA